MPKDITVRYLAISFLLQSSSHILHAFKLSITLGLSSVVRTFNPSNTLILNRSAAGLTIATGRIQSSTSWRAPLAIQIGPAAILLIFAYLLPEVSFDAFARFQYTVLKIVVLVQ